jgi:predicted ferric reductase
LHFSHASIFVIFETKLPLSKKNIYTEQFFPPIYFCAIQDTGEHRYPGTTEKRHQNHVRSRKQEHEWCIDISPRLPDRHIYHSCRGVKTKNGTYIAFFKGIHSNRKRKVHMHSNEKTDTLQNYLHRRVRPTVPAIALVCLYFGVATLPVWIVFLYTGSTGSFSYAVGKYSALAGFSLLTLQCVLSSRIKAVSLYFGLDMVIGFHRFMGMVAGVLILLHPLALALGSGNGSLLFSLSVRWYIWVGRGLLLYMAGFVLIAVFRAALRIEFQKWLTMHTYGAPLIIITAFIHSWVAGSDMRFGAVRIVWILFAATALGIIANHLILRPLLLRRKPYRVSSVIQEAKGVWTIEMKPAGTANIPPYLPGQFQFLTLKRAGSLPKEEHPFTISSSPANTESLCSSIKESGDYTATIGKTKVGDTAFIQPGFGRFSYLLHPEEKELVFIAGGIGITPLMSMIRYMHDTGSDRAVTLLYANNTAEDIAFKNELDEIAGSAAPKCTVVHFLKHPPDNWNGEQGYITGEKIRHYCGDRLDRVAFYLCGPPPMIEKIGAALAEMNISKNRIHYEKFSL